MADLRAFADNLVALDDINRVFRVYDRLHNTWVSFEYGDWIIRGVQGEFYPCKPDVFEATYEAAELAQDTQDVDAEAVR
ncbi:hypothetical protein [Streptomyces sp. A1136]|uniref:hypothetical protein n=1 Tax=Streptomyces sp. A1136 TaxID=2563102 RepID=UPI001F10396C|nr:hypothetical protein [Streptomyces sp. A1136]